VPLYIYHFGVYDIKTVAKKFEFMNIEVEKYKSI